MAIQYIPRQQNPWTSQLPGFLQNLMFQKMAMKQQDARMAEQQELAQAALEEQRAYKERLARNTRSSQLASMGHKEMPVALGQTSEAGGVPENSWRDPVTETDWVRRAEQPYKVGEVKTITIPDAKGQNTIVAQYTGNPKDRIGNLVGFKEAFRGKTKGEKTTEEMMIESQKKLQAQIDKEKQMAEYRQGLKEISIYNPQLNQSMKIVRNDWKKMQAGGKQGAWTETKQEKALSSEAELTRAALKGDTESKAILDAMQKRRVEVSSAQGAAQMASKLDIIDIQGTARAILDGRENMENVKNTFGVAVQEAVRKEVIANDSNFNFNKPRVKLGAIKSSLQIQYKQRGMMGSFVKNIDKQLARTEQVMNDVISRVGVRAIDLPLRELRTRFVGSGHEKVLEAYLTEISNEIGKLSTGSSASVRELSTEAQERWAKIHDPNLSLRELKVILDETQHMGQMRIDSTDDEIEETMGMLDNIRKDRPPRKKEEPHKTTRFKILRVE